LAALPAGLFVSHTQTVDEERITGVNGASNSQRLRQRPDMKFPISLSSFLVLIATPLIAAPAGTGGENSKPELSPVRGLVNLFSVALAPAHLHLARTSEHYDWKQRIVTTVFWIGESPAGNNPVPNRSSSWDKEWSRNYGGFDDPNPAHRSDFIPVKFTPRQNPFYCALPYNDKAANGHRPEAPQIVPWFKEAYQGPGVSVCKDRWIAIRKGERVAYAQWEDAGPFRTDHWQYVFGNERPKPNLNKGAGLDVSPAVRDYLGLQETDVTDWKFVDFSEVPHGPWARYGDNNTFVINERKSEEGVASKRLLEPPIR
jgi:hypothetical protein